MLWGGLWAVVTTAAYRRPCRSGVGFELAVSVFLMKAVFTTED